MRSIDKVMSKHLSRSLSLSLLLALSACSIGEPIKRSELLDRALAGQNLPGQYGGTNKQESIIQSLIKHSKALLG